MGADDILCPECGSDDLTGSAAGSTIELSCRRCGHRWIRTPTVVCRRCGTPNPYERQYWGWAYDDVEEAKIDTMASYDDILWAEYRCRHCNLSWTLELTRRTGRATQHVTDGDELA
jgi:ribosomal protein L37E